MKALLGAAAVALFTMGCGPLITVTVSGPPDGGLDGGSAAVRVPGHRGLADAPDLSTERVSPRALALMGR